MQAVSDVQGRLLALVKSILKQNAIAADLEPATLLVDVGLTSMDMVNLMLASKPSSISRFRSRTLRRKISSRSPR
jgi:hypothetical protein